VSSSPRCETSVVHRLKCLERYLCSLRNLRKRLNSWVFFTKSLGVCRCSSLDTLICLKIRIILLEHLCVPGLNIFACLETPEIFEGGVNRTFTFTQLSDFFRNFLVCERHPIIGHLLFLTEMLDSHQYVWINCVSKTNSSCFCRYPTTVSVEIRSLYINHYKKEILFYRNGSHDYYGKYVFW